jgi:hypothetical protein
MLGMEKKITKTMVLNEVIKTVSNEFDVNKKDAEKLVLESLTKYRVIEEVINVINRSVEDLPINDPIFNSTYNKKTFYVPEDGITRKFVFEILTDEIRYNFNVNVTGAHELIAYALDRSLVVEEIINSIKFSIELNAEPEAVEEAEPEAVEVVEVEVVEPVAEVVTVEVVAVEVVEEVAEPVAVAVAVAVTEAVTEAVEEEVVTVEVVEPVAEVVTEPATEPILPVLTGTDKQVAWASKIRSRVLEGFKGFTEIMEAVPTEGLLGEYKSIILDYVKKSEMQYRTFETASSIINKKWMESMFTEENAFGKYGYNLDGTKGFVVADRNFSISKLIYNLFNMGNQTKIEYDKVHDTTKEKIDRSYNILLKKIFGDENLSNKYRVFVDSMKRNNF